MMVEQMKSIQCTDYGPPARFATAETTRPALLPGHVRVRVQYCALGFPDFLIAAGKYQVKPEVPFIPGSEIAGVVTEVAADVDAIRIGDRVISLHWTMTGGLAEDVVLPVSTMVRVPQSVPLAIAAGMSVNYATAYYALVQRGALRPGENILVLGAAGGVGLAAVELSKALGARVIAAASTTRKLELARRHGADEGFNYCTQSIKTEVMRCTGGRGVDMIIDPVGGAYSEQALRAMAPGGRLLVVGFAAGEVPKIALNLTLLKNCAIVGVYLAAQQRSDPAGVVANVQTLFTLYDRGLLRPDIIQLDCFEDYDRAFEIVGERQHCGKVVVNVAKERLQPLASWLSRQQVDRRSRTQAIFVPVIGGDSAIQ